MGLTVLELDVANVAKPKVSEKVELLVDSGALYSVIPKSVLKKLGIKPIAKETFRLADGSKIVRQKGVALFRYGERVGGADVIFGERGEHALVGMLTLAALGFALDPLKRELKPLPMILANTSRSWRRHREVLLAS